MQSGSVTVKRNAVKQLELLNKRIQSKEWIEELLGVDLGPADEFEKRLRDGIILIELLNKLQPGMVNMSKVHYKCKTIANTEDTFKMIENITVFIDAAVEYGVSKRSVFSPIDLINEHGIIGLLSCLQDLQNITKPTEPEKHSENLANLPKKELLQLLQSAGINNPDDLIRVTQQERQDPVNKKLCIICKKPTRTTLGNGLIYYHKKCITCCKCDKYFMKAHEEGWFWRQKFYCKKCIDLVRTSTLDARNAR